MKYHEACTVREGDMVARRGRTLTVVSVARQEGHTYLKGRVALIRFSCQTRDGELVNYDYKSLTKEQSA